MTPERRKLWIDAAMLGLLAFALRWHGYLSEPFWSDEFYIWRWVSQKDLLSDILHVLVADIYPPLHIVAVWACTRLDDGVAWLRLPSLLGGVAAVLLTWRLLQRRFGRGAAFAGGLLAACSPLAVYYAQEAKMYPFFAALGLWTLDEFMRAIEEPQRPWWRLALPTALCAYTNYLAPFQFAALLLGGAALWLSGRRSAGHALKGLLLGWATAAPLLPFFLKSVAIYSGQGQALFKGGDRIPWTSAQNFSLGWWAPESWAIAAAALSLGGIALLFWRPRRPQAWAAGLIGLYAVLPTALNWLQSYLNPSNTDRAFLGSVHAWVAVTALGFWRLPARWRWAPLALLLGLQALALARYNDPAQAVRYDFQPAYQSLKAQWQPGEAVFHNDIQSLYPFKQYAYYEGHPMPNWTVIEAPQVSATAGRFRAIWHKFKGRLADLGYPIDASMEASRVWSPRLEDEALRGVKRLWYVQVDPAVLQKAMDTHINLQRAGFNAYAQHPKDPLGLPWLKANGFRVKSHQALSPGVEGYLFVR